MQNILGTQPHHDGSALHVGTESLNLNDPVRLRLRVPTAVEFTGNDDSVGVVAEAAPLAVWVRTVRDRDLEWTAATRIGTVDGWDWWEAEIIVSNPRCSYRWMIERPCGFVEWVNQAGCHADEPRDADDFALLTSPAPPSWMTDAVMYQVFPDRFARSNAADTRKTPEWALPAQWGDPVDNVMPGRSQQFYGGDLDGVVERLDHLSELGVTLLYLTPIFPAASNHRYDAASFDTIDPLLGGNEALIRLVRAAHERGMRVIGDLTTNHSGDGHAWFRAAYGRPKVAEGSFYYFKDDAHTEYESWYGHPSLPKFNWSSEELRHRFVTGQDSIVRRWLEPPYSLDGWRIDVANMTGRLGDIDINDEVRGLIRDTMHDINPEALLLAESTNDATVDLQGDGWHGIMSHAIFARPLWAWLSRPGATAPEDLNRGSGGSDAGSAAVVSGRVAPWFFGQPLTQMPQYTARQFRESIVRFAAGVPWRVRLGGMQPLDTHDTARFATHARPGTVPVAVGLSMTLPGIPTLFAGDEFGLFGADGEASRTPLPWGEVERPEVAERIGLYRELIGMRGEHAALREGGLRWLYADDTALAFVRESAEESVLIVAFGDAGRCEIVSEALVGVLSSADFVPLVNHGGVAFDAARAAGGVDGAGVADGAHVLIAEAPAFAAWQLPGVVSPGSSAPELCLDERH